MSFNLFNTILLFVSSGFLIFLALTVIRDNLRSRLNQVTGTMLFFAGLGPLFLALGQVINLSTPVYVDFEDIPVYNLNRIWEVFFPFLLLFAWTYPEDRLRYFHYRWIRYAVFIPPFIHILILIYYDSIVLFLKFFEAAGAGEGLSSLILKPLATFFSWLQILFSIIRTYHAEIFYFAYLFYVGLAIYNLKTSLERLTSASLRTQATIVLRGLILSLGILALTLIGFEFLTVDYADSLFTAGIILSTLVGSIAVAYAIIRYQFLNVRLVLRQSFVYTITYSILVGTFVILIIKSREIVEPLFGQQAEIFGYVLIVVLLLLFLPLGNWIDNLIRSIFIRSRTDYRNVLERFSRQIISVLNPKQLREIIRETMQTSLLVDTVYFVMFDDSVEEYVLLPNERFSKRVILARDDHMLSAVNTLTGPAYVHTLGNYGYDVQLSRELDERNVRLVLPMKEGEHLLGFLGLTDKAAGYRYTSEDFNLLKVLSNQMVTALINARLYVESIERLRLQEEVSMARQIQLELLPSAPPKLENFKISVHSEPSRTIGGDFYDFIQLKDNRLGIVIADASGKGMPAALMIAQIQAMIRSEVNNNIPIAQMLKNINEQISASTSPEKFVTLFYGELNPNTGEFIYSNAGHNYPVLVRADKQIEHLETGGTVIGAIPDLEYQSATVRLGPNDLLFFFTDGLSEAQDENDVEYGEERIKNMLCEQLHHDPENLIGTLIKDVRAFDPTRPPRDDTTIIALKMNHQNR